MNLDQRLKQLENKVYNLNESSKKYAIIYFRDRKPLKKNYETSMKAFYDYEDRGCIFVELFNENGIKISSYPKNR